MLKLYFAAPLFSEAERRFNVELARKLETRGLLVFLPQRDGAEHDSAHYVALSMEERREAIFAVDRMKILDSDIFLLVLDGRVPDEGACVELGIAYAQKYIEKKDKILVGLLTDSHAAFIQGKVNPMIGQALDRIFCSEAELLDFLDGGLASRQKASAAVQREA